MLLHLGLRHWCTFFVKIHFRFREMIFLVRPLKDLEQNQSDFKYEATMVRISALGWSSDLRNLPEINFIQLYDYLVVSREYRHIVLRGTHHWKYHRIPESEAKAVAL